MYAYTQNEEANSKSHFSICENQTCDRSRSNIFYVLLPLAASNGLSSSPVDYPSSHLDKTGPIKIPSIILIILKTRFNLCSDKTYGVTALGPYPISSLIISS